MLHQFKGTAVVLLLVAAVAAFFLRDDVFFLMRYDGKVIHVYREQLVNASRGSLESNPMAELEGPDGTRVKVEIPENLMGTVKPGNRLYKRRFSSRVMVQ